MAYALRFGGARRWTIAVTLPVLAMLFLPQPASGIPSFARKYETSCHTCHVAYPKLNPFGNAFRMRGYQMPGETEDMIKQEPVQLGADANKRLWPKALWPSTIPRHAPLSLDVRLAMVTTHDAASGETQSNDFRFPEAVELLAGGNFDEMISFLASLEAEIEHGHAEDDHGDEGGSGVELQVGHAELHFNGPWDTGTAFNIKIGRFTPEMTQQFSHGYLLTDSAPAAMFGFNPIGPHGSSEVGTGGHHGGEGGISLPGGVDGIEFYGIVANRFDYSLGVANGIGPGDGFADGNDSKDVFARVGYKLGGMTLDGEGDNSETGPENWREMSVRLGLFGYEGDGEGILFGGSGHHANELIEDRDFSRLGVDVNAYIGDVNLVFGYVDGEDAIRVFEVAEDDHGDDHAEPGDDHAEPGEIVFVADHDFEYKAMFGEADVVIFPWLHGAVRYEWLEPSRSNRDDFERFVVNLTALVRANVKALVEYRKDIGGDREDDYEVKAVLRFAL